MLHSQRLQPTSTAVLRELCSKILRLSTETAHVKLRNTMYHQWGAPLLLLVVASRASNLGGPVLYTDDGPIQGKVPFGSSVAHFHGPQHTFSTPYSHSYQVCRLLPLQWVPCVGGLRHVLIRGHLSVRLSSLARIVRRWISTSRFTSEVQRNHPF